MTEEMKKQARRRCPYEPDAIYANPHVQELAEDVIETLDNVGRSGKSDDEECSHCGVRHPKRGSGASRQSSATPKSPLLDIEQISAALERLRPK